MPGIRLLDAIELPDAAGALDAYCPKNYKYEEFSAEYEALRTCPGDEIWCYTCCFPGGVWPNRMLGQELLRSAYLGWGCHLFNLDGCLHWGFNQFLPIVRGFGDYSAEIPLCRAVRHDLPSTDIEVRLALWYNCSH